MARGRVPKPVMQRILERTEIVPGPLDTPCWIWTGALDTHGRGCITVGSETDGSKRTAQVHVVAHECLVGPIADGLERDHLCSTPACWCPEHLEAVTHRVNCLRGRGMGGRNARKTHCGTCGGPFTANYNGERVCRRCANERNRRWRLGQAARRATAGALVVTVHVALALIASLYVSVRWGA